LFPDSGWGEDPFLVGPATEPAVDDFLLFRGDGCGGDEMLWSALKTECGAGEVEFHIDAGEFGVAGTPAVSFDYGLNQIALHL